MRTFTQENTAGYTDEQLELVSENYINLMEEKMGDSGLSFDEFEYDNKDLSDAMAEKALEMVD